jgi:CRISPR/Cas system CSM-associated protein Csm4 (group 5 of RAMP superfamily)
LGRGRPIKIGATILLCLDDSVGARRSYGCGLFAVLATESREWQLASCCDAALNLTEFFNGNKTIRYDVKRAS